MTTGFFDLSVELCNEIYDLALVRHDGVRPVEENGDAIGVVLLQTSPIVRAEAD